MTGHHFAPKNVCLQGNCEKRRFSRKRRIFRKIWMTF
jgi:hypothetical protein